MPSRKTILLGLLAASLPLYAEPAASPSQRLRTVRPPAGLRFEPNVGQADTSAVFLAHGELYTVKLLEDGALLSVSTGSPGLAPTTVRLQFLNAMPGPRLKPMEPLGSVSNYYLGKSPETWRTGVPHYGRVAYQQVYPGIDVVYYGTEGKLEYDFVVAPGADYSPIRIAFTGADSLRVDPNGDLVLSVNNREIRQRKPVIYQQVGGRRVEVAGSYRLLPYSNHVEFALGSYDRRLPLTIDPVFEYATYIGGGRIEAATAIAVDATGAAYLTGYSDGFTISSATAVRPYAANRDAFVIKMTPTGGLAYITYLGGSSEDNGRGIAVDATGAVYVAGETQGGFPLLLASQSIFGGGSTDGFVTKLSPTGAIVFSTYVGGSGVDDIQAISLDPAGNIYVGGSTTGGLPVVNASSPTFGGGPRDAFAAKLNSQGIPAYLTYIGGAGDDWARGAAVDSSGNLFVAGTTTTGFPVLNAHQPAPGGSSLGQDAFVVKLNASGAPAFATYLGGSNNDEGRAIAVDSAGSAYVCGRTLGPFPTRNADRSTPGGSIAGPGQGGLRWDAFLTKYSPSGVIVYSTYVGAVNDEFCNAVAVDPTGAAYVTGRTTDYFLGGGGDLPQPTTSGGADPGFIAKYSPAGSRVYASYLGAPLFSEGLGVAADAAGAVYVAGFTRSGWGTFNAFQSTHGGNSADIMLAKIAPSGLISTARLSALSTSSIAAGGPNLTLTLTGTGFHPSATVAWNGSIVTVNSITANSAQVTVPSSLFQAPGMASVTLTNPGETSSNALLVTITIPPCTFNVSTNLTNTWPASGGTANLSVTTGQFCEWSVSDQVNWIQYNAFGTEPLVSTGSGQLFPFILSNPNPVARTAVVTVAGQNIVVNQTGVVCQLGLTPSLSARGPAAATGSLTIGATGAGCPWTASSSAPWLTLTSPTTGTGSATLNYALQANTTPFSRSATVTVNDRTATITQFGTNPCASFSLGHIIQAFPSAGGAGSVRVAAEGACPWTATSNAGWVTITSATGAGTGVVNFTVSPNPAFASRSAQLTIAGQTFIVTQAGAAFTQSCTISATPVNVSSEGRTEQVANINIACTGLGQAIAADLELTLNTSVTNSLVGGLADATLTGAGAPRNAQVAGYNLLRWRGLTLGPGNVALQISNVRVDASLLGVPSNLASVPVSARVYFNAPLGLPVTNPSITVAQSQPGVIVQPGFPVVPNPGGAAIFPIVFREGYATAFRAATPGDTGTRLRVVLSNVPSGIIVSAPVSPSEGASRARLLLADSTGAGGTPVTGVTHQPLTISSGVATATWELLTAESGLEFLTFPLLIQNATSGQLATISMDARASFAPVSAVSLPSATAPVPRYRDPAVPQRRVDLRIRTSVRPLTAAAAVSSKAGGVRAGGNFSPQDRVRIEVLPQNGDTVANNAVVRGNLPAGVLLTSVPPGFTVENGQFTASLGNLPPNFSQTYAIEGELGPELANGGTVSVTGSIVSDDPAIDQDATVSADSISVLPPPPSISLPAPLTGSGLTRTFVVPFTNPNGIDQFDVLNVLINNALDGGRACYIAYSWPARLLFLINDNGPDSGVTGPITLGVAGSVSNSQCTVNGIGSSAVGSGNTVTLTLNITFRSGFAGNRIVYLAARAANETNSGWTTSGVHEVPGAPVTFPNPVGMTPASGNTASGLVSFVYEDQTTANNLQTVWGLVNTALDGGRACYFAFFVPGNLLLLVPDDGNGGNATATAIPGAGFVENSQCRINAQGSSVVRSGSRLTLNLNMNFKSGFAGNKAVWIALQTLAARTSAWKATGAWQVPK